MLAEVGVKSVKLPPPWRNVNAQAERFIRSIKDSCLERMIPSVRARCAKVFASWLPIIIASETTIGVGNRLIVPDELHADNYESIRPS